MKIDKNRVFLSQKFDEVYDKFRNCNNEGELSLLEEEIFIRKISYSFTLN